MDIFVGVAIWPTNMLLWSHFMAGKAVQNKHFNALYMNKAVKSLDICQLYDFLVKTRRSEKRSDWNYPSKLVLHYMDASQHLWRRTCWSNVSSKCNELLATNQCPCLGRRLTITSVVCPLYYRSRPTYMWSSARVTWWRNRTTASDNIRKAWPLFVSSRPFPHDITTWLEHIDDNILEHFIYF